MFARISDNVLNEKDWGVDWLELEDGVVVLQKTVSRGCYRLPDLYGMTAEELVEWSRFDATGQHPEQYHELAESKLDDDGNTVPGKFHDFWTAEGIES
jgi:hypothetical protein